MKQTVFGIGDIPSSFRLENYSSCETWGVAEWWRALAYRNTVHRFFNLSPEQIAEDEDPIELATAVKDCALSYFEKPLPDFDDELRVYPARERGFPIRDLTGKDFYGGLYKLNDESYKPSADLAKAVVRYTDVLNAEHFNAETDVQPQIEGVRASMELDRIPAWSIHREANAPLDSFCIEVDLGASDEHLVKEFKQWLKRIRRESDTLRIPKRLDGNDFADWHAKRLLPYLDLTLWARANDGSINLPVLGHLLFPDEQVRGVEAMIRRTTAPKARQLITWPLISVLYTLMESQKH
jgi:Family of unknown function (DUF6387)